MNKMMTTAMMLALTMTVFADQATPIQPQTPTPIETDPNPQARWGTKDKGNFFIEGEVLWIKPLGMNFAQTQHNSSGQITSESYFSNEFTTGERVGLGYNSCYDGWDAVLEYTGFNYHHNNAGIAGYTSGSGSSATFVNISGTTSYTTYFNQGDLDFGRMMKISRKIKMRPHVGARVLWLTQKISFDYSTDVYSFQKNNNTLGGLELGLDSVWMFAKQFGVYANLGLTTLVNQQKTIISNNDTSHLNPGYNTSYGSKIVSGYDIKVGLRWDKNFSDDNYHFGINFGYEQHSLININSSNGLLANGTGNDASYVSIYDNDFTWQAIALGARFDF